MYSKKIQGFDLRYLQEWKAKIKRGHFNALPVSRTRGMKDFVLAFDENCNQYADTHDHVMDNSILKAGGYLAPDCGGFLTDGYIITGDNVNCYRAMMEAYDKYLCTDGVIRYRPTPEANEKCQQLYNQYTEDFWECINDAFEARGMHYQEDTGTWVNPETGEVGCY